LSKYITKISILVKEDKPNKVNQRNQVKKKKTFSQVHQFLLFFGLLYSMSLTEYLLLLAYV
jgi:hypothetical protein